MRAIPPLPTAIGGIAVPHDDTSEATWRWAHRSLPAYLFTHSVRAFCWGATIGATDGLAFDAPILWTASLMHDVGLTRIPRNTRCFEVEGGEIARRFLTRRGIARETAATVATAIVLHMAPNVTVDDGTEAVLLDRATSLDVRGVGFELVDGVRPSVMRDFPRGSFDRLFLAAIGREVARRSDCQSARLRDTVGLAGWMARSPWATEATAT
ncbi:MAG TPA: HD domain-containing protein [Candidatus Limnocylindrales bacterium]